MAFKKIKKLKKDSILHYTKLVLSIIHACIESSSALTECDSKISCHKWKNKPADLFRQLHPCEVKITVESQVFVSMLSVHNGLPRTRSATQLASCTVCSDRHRQTDAHSKKPSLNGSQIPFMDGWRWSDGGIT